MADTLTLARSLFGPTAQEQPEPTDTISVAKNLFGEYSPPDTPLAERRAAVVRGSQLTPEERAQMLEGEPPPGIIEKADAIRTGIMRGALGDSIGMKLKGTSAVGAGLENLLDVGDQAPASLGGAYQAGQQLQQFAETNYAIDPRLAGSFFYDDVPRGVGQAGESLLEAFATGGNPITPAVTGGLQMAGGLYDEAIKAGATEDQAQLVSAIGLPLGATEMVGLGGAFSKLARADRATGGSATRSLIQALKGGQVKTVGDGLKLVLSNYAKIAPKEIGQEMLQTYGENEALIQTGAIPDRSRGEGVLRSGAVAGVVSGPFSQLGSGHGPSQQANTPQAPNEYKLPGEPKLPEGATIVEQSLPNNYPITTQPVPRETPFAPTREYAKEYAATNPEGAKTLVQALERSQSRQKKGLKGATVSIADFEKAGIYRGKTRTQSGQRTVFANFVKEELENAAAQQVNPDPALTPPDTEMAQPQEELLTPEPEKLEDSPPIPPADIKYAPPSERPIGRPDLANPAVDPAARKFVDEVDEQRNQAKQPESRPRAVAVIEAEKALSDDYEGTKAKIIGAAKKGASLNEAETVAARRIVEREALEALKSNDPAKLKNAVDIVWSYREARGEQARALSLQDPVEPAARRRRALAEALFTPPQRQVDAIAKAEKRGDAAKADQIRGDWAKEIIRLKDKLKALGVDPDTLQPIKKTKAIKGKAAKARADFSNSLNDLGKFLEGRTFANPLDPELVKRVGDLVYKGAKSAGLSFAEFVSDMVDSIGVQNTKKLEPIIRSEWEKLSKADPTVAPPDATTSFDDTASNVAQAKVIGTIQAAKADNWDKAYEYWRNAILSAPITQSANVVGNITNAAWSMSGERLASAAWAKLTGNKKGAQFGEFKRLLSGFLPGLSRGARNALLAWKTETPYFEQSLGREGTSKFEEPNVAIEGTKGKIIRIPQRLLLLADEFSKSVTAQMEVGAQAYRIANAEGLTGDALENRIRELIADTNSDAWDQALHLSSKYAFQEPQTKIGQKATKLALQARKDIPGLRYVMPFITTPVGIFEAGLKPQRLLALLTLLVLLDNDDDDPWITGSTPAGKTGPRDLSRRTYPPQSIRIGDKWVSYARIEPLATTLGIAVDWANAVKSKDPESIAKTPAQSVLGQIGTKTFLSGLADIIEATQGTEASLDKIAKWGSNFATSWIPNAVRSAARNMDDVIPERSVWGKGTEWNTRLLRRTLQKTELGVIDDQPAVDLWGREAKRSVSPIPRTDWLYRMLVPAEVKTPDIVSADRVLLNWNNEHPEDEKFPLAPSKSYTVDGKTKYFTDEQYAKYAKLAGEGARKTVDKFSLHTDDPTTADIDIIEKAISQSRALAKSVVLGEKSLSSDEIGDQVRMKIAYSAFDAATDPPLKRKDKEIESEYISRRKERFKDQDAAKDIWERADVGGADIRREHRKRGLDASSDAFQDRLKRLKRLPSNSSGSSNNRGN